MIKVKKIGEHNFDVPSKGTPESAGYDLVSTETLAIEPGKSVLVPTGFAWEIPKYYCGQIWPRSGLAVKHNIDVHAGLIDSDYRGEVKVLLFNHGQQYYAINEGDRIAQIVVCPILAAPYGIELKASLDDTVRSDGGFGSTGK